jgi:hypothetical protein
MNGLEKSKKEKSSAWTDDETPFFWPSRRCVFVFQTMHFRVYLMVLCPSKNFKNASSGWSRSQKRFVTRPNTEVMTRHLTTPIAHLFYDWSWCVMFFGRQVFVTLTSSAWRFFLEFRFFPLLCIVMVLRPGMPFST